MDKAGETSEHVIIPIQEEEELPLSKDNAVRTGASETSKDVIIPIKEELPSSKENAVNRTPLMPLSIANRSQRRTLHSTVKKSDHSKAVNKHSNKILDSKEEIFNKFNELKAKEESRQGNIENQAKPPPKIQKVLPSLRNQQNLRKYCKPRAVSLGPIHHGRYPQAEEVKQRLAYQFIKDSGEDKEEDLYKKVEDSIDDLRACYYPDETKKYDNKKLAAILFLDGCSVLQFIYYTQKRSKDLKIKKDKVEFGRRDLFLLENQLPYKLLNDLMESSKKKEELKKAIKTFIRERGGNYYKKKELNKYCNLTEAIISLVRKTACNGGMPNEEETGDPIHLLDLLRTSLLTNPELKTSDLQANLESPEPDSNDDSSKKKQYSYRNVQELTAAGIQMRCNKNSLLKTIHFTPEVKIPFLPLPGKLWLPKITVDESTGPMFVNLIAYECCPDFLNDYGVTSYVSFLDSLIDDAKDVQKLKKAGILDNFLSSDEEVAQLFNEIASNYLVLDSDTDAYAEVKYNIRSFSRNRFRNWIQVHHCFNKYFSSPWTMLALFAGIFALVLTSIQTWYAVFPH